MTGMLLGFTFVALVFWLKEGRVAFVVTVLALGLIGMALAAETDAGIALRESRPTVGTQGGYPYRGASGLPYQYDLSRPGDRIKHELDIGAQIKDSIKRDADPRIQLDREFGQQGGGAK